MTPFVQQLPDQLHRQGGVLANLNTAICLEAGLMDWAHRDPFNRFLAATARQNARPLISADTVFGDIVTRIW